RRPPGCSPRSWWSRWFRSCWLNARGARFACARMLKLGADQGAERDVTDKHKRARERGLGTLAIHAGQEPDPSTGAVMTPIYATSTYVQSSPGVHQGFEYSRSHNPTRFAYERCVAALEGGSRGFAFASGLAATSTVLELLDSGSHVVAMDDLY